MNWDGKESSGVFGNESVACPILRFFLAKGGKPQISWRESAVRPTAGCPILATFMFLSQGWETTNPMARQRRLPHRTWLLFQRHRNLARIAAGGSNGNLACGLLANALELLAPFHQHQGVVGQQFVQAQRLQLPLAFQPVHVQVIAQPVAKMPFETALAELESIVDRLEKGAVALEESIKLYERGEALKTHCDGLLKNAEMRIEKITLSADGRPKGVSSLDGE